MDFLLIAFAGIVATGAMMGSMALLHRFQWANADMVRAIGSIYTRSYRLSFLLGLIVHYAFGIFFAYVYAMLIGIAPVFTPITTIIIASAAGMVHGIIVGLLLEVVVAEHHPLKKFRKAGARVVIAHIIGHQAYGTTLGVMFALLWTRLQATLGNFVQGNGVSEVIGYSFIWLPLLGIPLFFLSYIRSKTHDLETPAKLQNKSQTKSKKNHKTSAA